MNNALELFTAVFLATFFGVSWVMLAGNWLGLDAFSRERYIVGELLPLAYGGASLSVIFLFAVIAVKLKQVKLKRRERY